MEIRKANKADSDYIHRLAWQLGYSSDIELVQCNIEKVLNHPDYDLVVAVDETNTVIGWMSLVVRLRIEDVPFLQVAALVTDEKFRGKGTGRLLMDYAAKVAKSRGLRFVGLHSSKPRTDAHAFYNRVGYKKSKESFFFTRDIE